MVASNSKDIDLSTITPIIISLVNALRNTEQPKSFDLSAQGGITTPLGGFGVGGDFGWKDWQDAIPTIVSLAQALAKNNQPAPAAVNADSKGIDLGSIIGAIGPIIQALTKSQVAGPAAPQKLFGIDDAILGPAIISLAGTVINALKKSGNFPDPATGKGFDPTSLLPIIVPIIHALTKNQPEQQQKLFGIDDAILIPAVVSLVGTVVNALKKSGQFAPPAAGKDFNPLNLIPAILPFIL